MSSNESFNYQHNRTETVSEKVEQEKKSYIMDDILQEIQEDNLEVLKKYTTHNERIAEVEYHPFIDLNDYKNKIIENINNGEIDGFGKKEIKKEENTLDILEDISKNDQALKIEPKEKESIMPEEYKIDKNLILEGFNENEEHIENKKNKDKVVYAVYEYLFESFYNFNLCFSELKNFLPRLGEINTSETNGKPKEVNVEIFLKKYRAVGLLQKINLIAYYLGKYNYNLFVENISEKILNESNEESFGVEIVNKYNGTEFDFYYIENFNKIIEGDKSDKYVFNENKEVNISEEPLEIQQKDNKKGLLKLKPFKL